MANFLGITTNIYWICNLSSHICLKRYILDSEKGMIEIINTLGQKVAEKEFEGLWWRVYKVPQNGILNTKFEIKGNSISYSGSKYFFVDKNGNRKEIKRFSVYCDEKDTSTVQMIAGNLCENEKGKYQVFYIEKPR